ncbi:MAG: enoyl-CoA hydratase/isomerase family protein [Deltaproteobacteria bacterium]|nr:enoyl-CoA hydratase/isomerase family protein [Deltaproteobacteria bacterium]MBW1950363.1 enoyl-CoA hydratase/isomerase family protein [Deltaproteobacteria bacterium]MBW2008101.1 enoyl-CoA hydratase/isomerase family protein [Deltaproteobacteria bacterium]MBW2102429.1 enoyl-CoA hydratase/isomerase family protein [Deltaproteobacteria bacterium]
MKEFVLREDREAIAVLTLNRPEVLNALSPALFVELRTHVDDIAESADAVGCVILRGAGRSFCAGNDIKALLRGEKPPGAHFQAETIDRIEALPQPVICAVHGHCYTGGLELALGCDLLIAAESARFGDTHAKWGLTPTWGMSQRLPRRIGYLRAGELMFTSRTVTGEEAARIGLANRCVPDEDFEETVMDLARSITSNSWYSVRTMKQLVRGGEGLRLNEGLQYERETSPGEGPDARARLSSFGKR